MNKRIAIGMISHETNVFSPIPTPLQAWKDRSYYVGDEILEKFTDTKSQMGAYIASAHKYGWEIIPTIAASATPSAPTDAYTYNHLKELLLGPIAEHNPDAVLLFVHGAMIAEGVIDPEGDLAESIKCLIGNRPLLLAMDLHGNVTENMSRNCDAVFAFDTNPHIDGYERALEAAECLQRIFNEDLTTTNAYSHRPMMAPTINMRTAEGPMVELHQLAKEWEAKPGIINVSIFSGFPYGDVPHSGLSIITTAEKQFHKCAQACSEAIANRAWEIREQFLKKIPNPIEGLDQVEQLLNTPGSGPIILADVADNPGGGGSGDTTELLRELVKRNIPGSAAAPIWDPATVQRAIATGLGNEATFRIGGKAESAYGLPIEVVGKVRVLSDGRFIARGPQGRGMEWNMGHSAVIEVGHTKIVVCSIRIACNDADIFRNVGIDPVDSKVLLVKSRGHFRASFEPFAKAIIEIDAPGAANPNLSRYNYQHIDRPMWPLDKA